MARGWAVGNGRGGRDEANGRLGVWEETAGRGKEREKMEDESSALLLPSGGPPQLAVEASRRVKLFLLLHHSSFSQHRL